MDNFQKYLILKNVSLFKDLNEEEILAVCEAVEKQEMLKDEHIFEQGESGNEMFIVGSGKVAIQQQKTTLVELKENAFFGELALFGDVPRAASAICSTEGILLVISRDEFQNMISLFPKLLKIFATQVIHYLTQGKK